MKFTLEFVEYALLIIVRITAIIMIAPIFNSRNIPTKLKGIISLFLSLIVLNTVDYNAVSYEGILGYSILVVKEAITGTLIGFGSGICLYILNFSGHMIDMEIGFSMAMEFDPTTNVQSTVTAQLLNTALLLVFLVSDMHYFVIDALYDSYQLIPVGKMEFSASLYQIVATYMTDYFVIGVRIVLPIFACILVINIVLGILAKVAPQMNMFVIGMQLKVLVGLCLLFFIMTLLPGMSDMIFEEMQKMTKLLIHAITP